LINIAIEVPLFSLTSNFVEKGGEQQYLRGGGAQWSEMTNLVQNIKKFKINLKTFFSL